MPTLPQGGQSVAPPSPVPLHKRPFNFGEGTGNFDSGIVGPQGPRGPSGPAGPSGPTTLAALSALFTADQQIFSGTGNATGELIDLLAALKEYFASKGQLIVGTGAGTGALLSVGSDTQVLTADSTQTDGIKWAAAPVTASNTVTLSNKRITRRYVTVTQSATPTINTDNTDTASITGLAQAITSMTTNLSGTPNGADQLIVEITDNGTARAITWGASFEASTVTLPATTVISTKLTTGFIWNVATSKWRCVAVA